MRITDRLIEINVNGTTYYRSDVVDVIRPDSEDFCWHIELQDGTIIYATGNITAHCRDLII